MPVHFETQQANRSLFHSKLVIRSHTLEWFPSTKNSASVRPAPVLMGGALNSSYTPPSPCVCSSRTSVLPVSANVLTPLDARVPRRNSANDLLCERPAHTHAHTHKQCSANADCCGRMQWVDWSAGGVGRYRWGVFNTRYYKWGFLRGRVVRAINIKSAVS